MHQRVRRPDARPQRDTILQAWGAVDPHKGQAAIDEAVRAVREHHVLGFHFHPIMGHYSVDDPALRPLFDAIAELGVPVMVDVGTTGMGAGLPGGLGSRIRHAHPMCVDELAATFPQLTIIAAHPGWPWVDEMTAVALHKGNVFWELSGLGAEVLPREPQARRARPAARQGDVRQRLPEHAVRAHLPRVGRARATRTT